LYNVKALERAGIVAKVREERVKGIMQGIYQASARSIALSPRLVARLGGRSAITSSVGLSRLLDAADRIIRDIQVLSDRRESATLTIDATVDLPAEQRASFLRDAQKAVEELARRYGAGGGGQQFRMLVTCYESPGAVEKEE
jgi:hypothetical protein